MSATSGMSKNMLEMQKCIYFNKKYIYIIKTVI